MAELRRMLQEDPELWVVAGDFSGILKAMAATEGAFSLSELEQYLKKYDPSLKILYLSRRLRELSHNGYIVPVKESGKTTYAKLQF